LVSLTSTVFCTSNHRRKCPHKLPNLILLKSYFACHEAKTDNGDIILRCRQQTDNLFLASWLETVVKQPWLLNNEARILRQPQLASSLFLTHFKSG